MFSETAHYKDKLDADFSLGMIELNLDSQRNVQLDETTSFLVNQSINNLTCY